MVKKQHDAATELMAKKPHVIGLDGIILSTSEAHMFRPGTETLYHQPDALFFDHKRMIVYNVEYKCNHDLARARRQLQETEAVLRQVFPGYNVVSLYVHGDYEVERLRGGPWP